MNNPKVKINKVELLSDNWYTLRKYNFDFQKDDGSWETQEREAYDRGNGAAILLYNVEQKTVILTRQFRMPTYVNGNESGLMIEACAGILDEDNPEDCIRRETEEETGYQVDKVEKVMEIYMSPGSVTEILYLFIAAYNKQMKIHDGGGVPDEQENIEVLEIPFEEAYHMIKTGEIKDAKTVLLLQHLKLRQIL
ncbi:MAG: GDP-mannose pyrophosphatase NudK [Saprospiraceae bacterium]|nr:GDP-mannose pyrophosphatase NudK [Saprospiraceae bacterium]